MLNPSRRNFCARPEQAGLLTAFGGILPAYARGGRQEYLSGRLIDLAIGEQEMSNIRQNLFFAFIYNAAGVPIAAGVLYPFFGLLLSPIIAGAAMSLSSVSVVAYALRLRSVRL